jgi:hypothetical protein
LYSLLYDDVDVDNVDVDDVDVDDNVDDDVQDASCTVKITSPKSAFYRAINRCSSTTNDFNTPFFFAYRYFIQTVILTSITV